MKRVLGFVSVALTCLASASAAQSNKGGISGTVFDESGGVVAAALVRRHQYRDGRIANDPDAPWPISS